MPPLDWMDARALGGVQPGDGPAGAPAARPGLRDADPELVRACLLDLNEPQREAVQHAEGPLLILAGAGSGKTRVITRRIAWLVATGHASPHEILAITFTNKAAREMRERVELLLPVRGMWISTFHAMCARLLRREVEVLGTRTRDFTIYDTHDRNQLLKDVTKELGYDVQRFRPGVLGSWISAWKTSGIVRGGDDEPQEVGMETEVFTRVRDRYLEAMRKNDALDFDDLLVETLRLFDEHPGVRDAYARRFRFVLVDEYQDTNRIQYLLTRHLAGGHGNLAVCGDPDQSIYAWRGADIRNILDFEQDFGGRDVRVVKLEQNYRSTQWILRAAQGVIRNNLGRKEKDLWTERRSDQLVQLVQCGDENDEANEIAARIHGLRARGTALDGIATFYRANYMQRALERALRLAGIPYQIVGGVEFYQRREIRDLVAYLQLAVNRRDDVACRRVLNVPVRGVGDRSAELLGGWAAERGLSLSDAARSEEARALLRGRAKAGVAAFAELLERLSALADGPAAAALHHVLDETEYLDWLASAGDPEVASRVENVEELLAGAETYDKESPEGGLRGFLQEVALVSDVDAYEESVPRVTLMTLHASKGLEFPAVFVCGLEEELLPHALALAEEDGVEEERRLFYVGMTRAQDVLCLSYARTRMHFGETAWRQPSRFLEELPPDCLEGGGLAASEELRADEVDDPLGAYDPPADAPVLREGVRVEHDHFGLGRVSRLQGSGANARVTVDFQSVGSKILLVQYAGLKVLGG